MTRRRRHLLAVLPALALVACGTAAAPSVGTNPAATHLRPATTRSTPRPAPLPPIGASPAQVVAAYVAALNAHDIGVARQLLTARHATMVAAAADSWFVNVVRISELKLGDPIPEGGGPGSLAAGYRQVVQVPVTFTLRQKRPESIPDGHVIWGYVLVRDNANQRWLIVDEGPA